jgi:hypothetical protein
LSGGEAAGFRRSSESGNRGRRHSDKEEGTLEPFHAIQIVWEEPPDFLSGRLNLLGGNGLTPGRKSKTRGKKFVLTSCKDASYSFQRLEK